MSIHVLAAANAAAFGSSIQNLDCSEGRCPQLSSYAGISSTFDFTKRSRSNPYNAAAPVIAIERSVTKTAFYGKHLMNVAWKAKSSSRTGRRGIASKSAVHASVLEGVHMEPGGLVVLEEETKLTQDEWEEAKNTVRAKKATERWIEQVRAALTCGSYAAI